MPDKHVCAGCQTKLIEGEGTCWCPSDCVCLGAVWCQACWNIHIDRKYRDKAAALQEAEAKLQELIDQARSRAGEQELRTEDACSE